jgi:hypothetical protein
LAIKLSQRTSQCHIYHPRVRHPLSSCIRADAMCLATKKCGICGHPHQ